MNVPEIAQVNESVTLFCDYDLEGQRLHSVKWFKDRRRDEFYRYSPEERFLKKIFLVRHLNVDVSKYWKLDNRQPNFMNVYVP